MKRFIISLVLTSLVLTTQAQEKGCIYSMTIGEYEWACSPQNYDSIKGGGLFEFKNTGPSYKEQLTLFNYMNANKRKIEEKCIVIIKYINTAVLEGQDLINALAWEFTKPSKGEWGVVTQEEFEEIAAKFEAFKKTW